KPSLVGELSVQAFSVGHVARTRLVGNSSDNPKNRQTAGVGAGPWYGRVRRAARAPEHQHPDDAYPTGDRPPHRLNLATDSRRIVRAASSSRTCQPTSSALRR